MYVKALRLAGFKSFADPTVLEFEPGINVIVGPNGSGKSNIADALAWVLGSQAPSALRGANMEDVIFAGSNERPRLGISEVELTLDNSTGTFPLNVAEVTVSRSTDRAGASEYRINGTPCRLLDVTELLSDTGIGRSLHALVGQGQLDQVLQARPEDRRSFIEEAAQIAKFRRRKERSLKKLERVEDNITRLNDVLTELKRTVRPLKRQATAATAHSELMAEYQSLKQRLTATELAQLAADEADLDLETEERRREHLADELDSVRARLKIASQERESRGSASDKAQEIAFSIGRAADRLEALTRLARERGARFRARLAAETEEGYRERIRLLEREQARWRSETGDLEASATTAAERAVEARARADAAHAESQDAEQTLAAARAREIEVSQALVRAEGADAATRATIGAIEARVQSLEERKALAEQNLERESTALARAQQDSRSLETELDRATSAAAEAEATLESRRETAAGLRERLAACRETRAAAHGRVQALHDALEALRGVAGGEERLRPLVSDAESRLNQSLEVEGEASEVVKAAESEVEVAWQKVAQEDEELRRLDALLSGAAERIAGSRRTREAREVEVAALNEELARARETLAEAENSAVEQRAVLPAQRAAVAESINVREQAEESVSEARVNRERLAADAGQLEAEARAAQERLLAARLRYEEAEAGIADARRALAGLAEARNRLSMAVSRTDAIAVSAGTAASTAEQWAREARSSAQQARAAAVSAEETVASLRRRERELETALQEVVERRNRGEIRRAEMRARASAVVDRALDEWGLSGADLEQLPNLSEHEQSEAKSRVEELERQIRRLGPVNPNAAQEYAEVEERQNFLLGQISDLRSSKGDLLNVIREVDDTIVEVFGTAYEDVARQFEVTFQRLFPGGTGALKLTNPGDLLTTGIEVEARPAGKNVKKLSLLSGGERALVALAFLFAIFRARPSPFYMLDEVEAALDDVNLQRFLTLVHDLRERAQVLIVTHQKRTMEAADVLYGVTMGKQGVSQVVARRMEEISTA